MIELKDLKHREYKDKICIRFQYEIPGYVLDFRRILEDEDIQSNDWFLMITSIGFSRTREAEIYKTILRYPNDRPLLMVCANGLYNLQLELKAQVQEKSNLDFYIGDLIADMKG